jgi:serine/threonine protein kinase
MPSLSKYELHEELGKGRFTTVYRATHKSLHTVVALKLLAPALTADEKARQRFIQEAQTTS